MDLSPSGGAAEAAAAETHISVLFFAGDRAYKFLKPVDFGFLDHSTREKRVAAANREVEVNSRLSPDVYLGVAELRSPGGDAGEPAIVMRRMPGSARLSALLSGPSADDHLREVARVVGAFHARAERSEAANGAATRDAVEANWIANFEAMEPLVGTVYDPDVFEQVQRLAGRYLAGRSELFDERIRAGHACDGHGDLLTDDIFCLPDGPRILDCLAFDDQLRYSDVLADIAFLLMDVERRSSGLMAERLMGYYHEFTGEHHPASLAHHYVAYRAQVRAKVAGLRSQQDDRDAPERGRRDLALALDHLRRAEVRLILVGGTPATGKTTYAQRLGERIGAVVLSTDELRKELAGISPTADRSDNPDYGLYEPDQVSATYAEMLRRAGLLLAHGETVVLDASWTDAAQRTEARALAERASARMVEIQCDVPEPVALERLRKRRATATSASDATPEVLREMRSRCAPWPEATSVRTDQDPRRVDDEIISVVDETDEPASIGPPVFHTGRGAFAVWITSRAI